MTSIIHKYETSPRHPSQAKLRLQSSHRSLKQDDETVAPAIIDVETERSAITHAENEVRDNQAGRIKKTGRGYGYVVFSSRRPDQEPRCVETDQVGDTYRLCSPARKNEECEWQRLTMLWMQLRKAYGDSGRADEKDVLKPRVKFE